MIVRQIKLEDKEWVRQALKNLWGSEEMVVRGRVLNLSDVPGFISEEDRRKVGLITYKITGEECEITSLNTLTPGKGIGTALLAEVERLAKEKEFTRLVVSTTNDNTKALHFYQKRGFVISAIRVNIMPEYRKLKPQIPEIGEDGIPLRDEIELQKRV